MHRPSRDAWGYLYLEMRRRGSEQHRRSAPVDGSGIGAVVFCGVVLAVFFALMFAARFVPIGVIATSLFWTGIGAVLASGIVGTAPPRFLPSWIGNVLAVIVIVCVVAWPVSVLVWLQSLAP